MPINGGAVKWGPETVQHEGRTEITVATNDKRNNQNQTGISRLIYTEGAKKTTAGRKEVGGERADDSGEGFCFAGSAERNNAQIALGPVFRRLILR